MKLYAKVTSERASKGQGGNKFLSVDFTVGDAIQNDMVLRVIFDDRGFIYLKDKDGDEIRVYTIENLRPVDVTDITKKGKKQ